MNVAVNEWIADVYQDVMPDGGYKRQLPGPDYTNGHGFERSDISDRICRE